MKIKEKQNTKIKIKIETKERKEKKEKGLKLSLQPQCYALLESIISMSADMKDASASSQLLYFVQKAV